MDYQRFWNTEMHGFPLLLNDFQKAHVFKNKHFRDFVKRVISDLWDIYGIIMNCKENIGSEE